MPTENTNISFEDALKKLEAIVEKMESGKLSLDDMIKQFEEGDKLSKFCEKKLVELEKKIEILKSGTDESPEWEEIKYGEKKDTELVKSARTKKKISSEVEEVNDKNSTQKNNEELPF